MYASAKSLDEDQENNWLPVPGRSVFEAWLERRHTTVNDESAPKTKADSNDVK
jgi:hypothetical protein